MSANPPATPRRTVQVRAVLAILLSPPLAEHYGQDIARHAGLIPATVYTILTRLASLGWVTDRWEQLDPHAAGRPRRRYFQLTEEGTLAAQELLDPTRPHHQATTGHNRSRQADQQA